MAWSGSYSKNTKKKKNLTPKGLRQPKWLLHFWAGYYKCMKLLELLKLLEAVGVDSSFPMRHSMWHLDSRFNNYGVLKISAFVSGRLPTTVNATIFAQNCLNSAHRQNFEIPPKVKILVFFKNKKFYM